MTVLKQIESDTSKIQDLLMTLVLPNVLPQTLVKVRCDKTATTGVFGSGTSLEVAVPSRKTNTTVNVCAQFSFVIHRHQNHRLAHASFALILYAKANAISDISHIPLEAQSPP